MVMPQTSSISESREIVESHRSYCTGTSRYLYGFPYFRSTDYSRSESLPFSDDVRRHTIGSIRKWHNYIANKASQVRHEEVKQKQLLTLSNDDVDLQVVAVGDGVVVGVVAALSIGNVVAHELPLTRGAAVRVAVAVVLGGNDDTSLIVREVGHDVAPTLVVMHAERDDEVLARVGDEAKGARGATAAHREDVCAVDLAPGTAIGVVPHRLLDDAEEGLGVGLVDVSGDSVRHAGQQEVNMGTKQSKTRRDTPVGWLEIDESSLRWVVG